MSMHSTVFWTEKGWFGVTPDVGEIVEVGMAVALVGGSPELCYYEQGRMQKRSGGSIRGW